MADGTIYKDVLLTATVKKEVIDGSNVFSLDVPFKVYGMDIVKGNELVTYSLGKLEGQKVLAKVDYHIDEEPLVDAYIGKVDFLKDKTEYGKFWDKPSKFCVALIFDNVKG